MADSVRILDYKGPVNQKVIDQLLKKLKKEETFLSLDRTTGKRVYSVLVECLENISKHSEKVSSDDKSILPYVSIAKTSTKVLIEDSNPVTRVKAQKISNRLDIINKVADEELHMLYDDMINISHEVKANGCVLGLMLMNFRFGIPREY